MDIDLDTSIGFLRDLRPSGPWNLCSMTPDGPIASATFTDPDQARPWLWKHAETNLYFAANPASRPTGKGGRGNKDALDEIQFVHVDIDVDKLTDTRSLDERKAAALARLEADDSAPTFVLDSGGGLQALWRLDESVPATAEGIDQVEGMNRWTVQQYGGDGATVDVSRLLRLPGTVNYPDAKKRARGRVIAPTRLLRSTDEVFELWQFGHVPAAAKATIDVEFGAPEEVDFDSLIVENSLDDRLVTIVRDGRLDTPKPGDDSNSAWLFDATCNLLRAGVVPEQVLWLLLNPELGISASVLDPAKRSTPEQQLAYAERQVRNGLAQVRAEQQADQRLLADEPVGDNSETEWPAWFKDKWAPIGQRDIAAIPPTPWLTPGLLLYGDVTTIGGRGGSGKSLLGWQIVVSVATGLKLAWWPAPVRPRKVLVISGEDDVNEIERRVSAACQAMNLKRSDLGDNFMVWTDRNIRLAVKDGKTGKITRTKLWHGIRWAVGNLDVGLVVMDPLVKVSSGFDESSNDDMDSLYAIIRELTVGCECAALNIDHFAKGGTGGDQASIRGASAKVDAARVAITLTGMTEAEYEKLRPSRPREAYALCIDAKQNYAAKSGGHWLEFIDFEVGNGEVRPSLVWRDLSALDEFLDPQGWQHRSAFLRMVADGCVEDGKAARPWGAAASGPKLTRLVPAVAQEFDLTEKQADAWVNAFMIEDSIKVVEWTRPNRTVAKVWALNPDFQTEEDAETEAIRE